MAETYLLKFKFTNELKDQVELALYQSGQYAFQEVNDHESADGETTAEIICYFATRSEAENTKTAIADLLAPSEIPIELDSIPTANWQDTWKDFANPVSVSPTLHVVPSFIGSSENYSGLVLRVDPEQAFGSGSHETTRLCLELIELLFQKTFISSCLDIGCGSGILSIAASRLGASSVLGIDLDETIIETAKRNAVGNLASNCRFETTPLAEVDEKFDLVVANILSSTIELLWKDLLACCKPNSVILLSGILIEEVQDLTGRLGIESYVVKEAGEWAALRIQY